MSVKFRKVNYLRHVQLTFDLTNEPDKIESLHEHIKIKDIKDANISFKIYILENDVHRLDLSLVIEKIKKHAKYHTKIHPTIVKTKMVRIKNLTANEDPIKALRKFVEAKNPSFSKEIIKKGKAIIKGE